MLAILLHLKAGRLFHRLSCGFVVPAFLLLGLDQAAVKAELIPAVGTTDSTMLRAIIESEDSVFNQLWSWSEFSSMDIPLGAHADSVVADTIETLNDHVSPTSSLPPSVGMHYVGGSNSMDSSNSPGSAPPSYDANLNSCLALSDSLVLGYLRGRDFLHIPDAPSAGLFRPPRHFQFDTAI